MVVWGRKLRESVQETKVIVVCVTQRVCWCAVLDRGGMCKSPGRPESCHQRPLHRTGTTFLRGSLLMTARRSRPHLTSAVLLVYIADHSRRCSDQRMGQGLQLSLIHSMTETHKCESVFMNVSFPTISICDSFPTGGGLGETDKKRKQTCLESSTLVQI